MKGRRITSAAVKMSGSVMSPFAGTLTTFEVELLMRFSMFRLATGKNGGWRQVAMLGAMLIIGVSWLWIAGDFCKQNIKRAPSFMTVGILVSDIIVCVITCLGTVSTVARPNKGLILGFASVWCLRIVSYHYWVYIVYAA